MRQVIALFLWVFVSISAQAAERVLYIGDSISMDEFGIQMQKLFLSDPLLSNLHFYSGCGTKPSNWLGSIRKNDPYITRCGYWEKHPGQKDIHVEWSLFGTPPHSIPYLENMLLAYNPSLVIVQLGLNMLDDEKPRAPLNTDWVYNQFKNFRDTLEKLNPSPLRKCFWISPNKTTLWSSDKEQVLVNELKRAVEPFCTVIDGRLYSRSNEVRGDGYHLQSRAATRFASDAFEAIKQRLPRR